MTQSAGLQTYYQMVFDAGVGGKTSFRLIKQNRLKWESSTKGKEKHNEGELKPY